VLQRYDAIRQRAIRGSAGPPARHPHVPRATMSQVSPSRPAQCRAIRLRGHRSDEARTHRLFCDACAAEAGQPDHADPVHPRPARPGPRTPRAMTRRQTQHFRSPIPSPDAPHARHTERCNHLRGQASLRQMCPTTLHYASSSTRTPAPLHAAQRLAEPMHPADSLLLDPPAEQPRQGKPCFRSIRLRNASGSLEVRLSFGPASLSHREPRVVVVVACRSTTCAGERARKFSIDRSTSCAEKNQHARCSVHDTLPSTGHQASHYPKIPLKARPKGVIWGD
jgi:hypothetical protein